jgi:hypothetical protein
MTTLTFDSRLDLPAPGPVRTWLVELRKLVDTRSGVALVSTGAVLAGVFGGGTMLFRDAPTLTGLVTMAGMPGGIVAAVASVLLVTAEWTHRTALGTYALTPRRSRVIAAKAAGAATLAVLVTGLALLAALVIAPVGTAVTGHPVTWTLDVRTLAVFSAANVCLALSAWALAYLARNAPAPIVILLVWPMLASLIRQAGPGAAEALSWIDQDAVSRLAGATSQADLGRAATSVLVWIVLPAAVGVARELRAQVR